MIKRLPREPLAAALLAACLGLLSSCGPGTGGTGTGPSSALPEFGATAAPLCGAPFAANLNCAAPSAAPTPAPGAAAAGTSPVLYVDATRTARARFEGNDVRFTVNCTGLVFDGTWGTRASGGAFFGWAGGLTLQSTTLASLSADAQGNATLMLTLRDMQGTVLAGPVILQKQPDLALACP